MFLCSFTVDESEVWADGVSDSFDNQIEDLRDTANVEMSQEDINFMYNAILHVADLSDSQKRSLNEALFDLAHQLLDTCQEEPKSTNTEQKARAAKALYMLVQYCMRMERVFKSTPTDASISTSKATSAAAKKSKKSKQASATSYIWPEWRSTCLTLFHKMLSGDSSALFAMGLMPENFVMLFWKYPLELLEEKPVGLTGVGTSEQASKKLCLSLLLLACQQVASGPATGVTVLVTAVLDGACRQEHLASPLADICRAAGVGSAFVTELMAEIARLNMTELSKGNGSGARNIGCFLVAVAAVYPELIALYLPLLMHHMDADVYQIRCAIITAMGSTITFIHQQCQAELAKGQSPSGLPLDQDKNEEDGEEGNDSENEKDESAGREGKFNMRQFVRLRDDMVDMLIERTHDVSSYARAAVLKVWVTLVSG